MCEGEVLLKRWKQGNTLFGKAIRDPIIGGLFLCKFFASLFSCVFTSIPYKCQKFDDVQNDWLSKYFLFGSIIAQLG